ncbi:MAG: LON peptidase substrate-binding domain-containing protein [Geminicoccaceae bacterium]
MSSPESLPSRFPIFPLAGALLLPGGNMPLNIFEPRYLQMTRDAMQTDKVIGMVQTRGDNASEMEVPPVYRTGCVGRISNFEETDDGRYLITLIGVCRFDVEQELTPMTPYRQVNASFDRWLGDLDDSEPDPALRISLVAAMRSFFDKHDIEADWDAVQGAPLSGLVTSLSMICPFEVSEKQALLEAADQSDRARILISLMQMEGSSMDLGRGAIKH